MLRTRCVAPLPRPLPVADAALLAGCGGAGSQRAGQGRCAAGSPRRGRRAVTEAGACCAPRCARVRRLTQGEQSEVESAARKLRAALKDTEVQRDELRQKLEALEQEAHKSKLSEQASSDEVQSEAARAEKEASEREAALQASVAAHATRMASLQATLAAAEARSATREDALRAQLARLERRCQELEAARDELVANDTEATVPLLRELEAVTAAAARAADTAADTEARLLSRLQARALVPAARSTPGVLTCLRAVDRERAAGSTDGGAERQGTRAGCRTKLQGSFVARLCIDGAAGCRQRRARGGVRTQRQPEPPPAGGWQRTFVVCVTGCCS